TLGFNVQALAGVTVSGNVDQAAKEIAAIEAVDYVVITAGRFDIMIEVVAEDAEHLLALMNQIRDLEPVAATELFTYLRLEKQTYNWGTR
ncbi:MAG: Lrp/AsnC ligand binding domain-containing protein, partial [Acidimicrobiia bacterium]